MSYNEDIAIAIAQNIDNPMSQAAIEEAVYEEVANKGWLVNQDDVAEAVKMIQIYEMYRGGN